ncbi:MAG: trigger factor [Actinomycetota bacterium]|nr:trigger factor [Actinomycetota bacterium]
MKSAVETLNPTRVKLTVEVPFDELKPSLDRAYKTIGSQVQVPGFRKGHVPPRIIDQRIGRGAVLEEAVNEALPQFYARAMEEGELRPLGRPSVDVTDVPDPKDGGDLKFTVEVDIRPEITLPALDSIEVTVDDLEVTEADVDERLEALRERFGTLSTVERAVVEADYVTIDIQAEIDGEEIDSVKGVSYQLGSGTMLPGIDEALTGLQAGETTTFTAPLAGGDRAGQDSSVTVTVQAVKERLLPQPDDEFAELASEFDTLEELREDLRQQVTTMKRYEQAAQARERFLEHMLEVLDIPVPDGVVAEEVARHLEGENRSEDDEHRTEVDAETRTQLRTQLLLDAFAESEAVSVNQQELIEYLVMSARQYGMDPNEFAQAVDEAEQVPAMVQEVARNKALVIALSKIGVKDASGNVVDLQIPVEDEEDAEGEEAVELPEPTGPATADPTALPSFGVSEFEPDEPAVTEAPKA